MKYDHELLEAVAKACGWEMVPNSAREFGGINVHTGGGSTIVDFNPLTKDAQVFQLMAKMAVNVRHWSFFVPEAHYVTAGMANWEGPKVMANGDPAAAMRLAVCQALVMYGFAKERYDEEARAAASISTKGDGHG